MIVGATPSPDAVILQTADRLYRSFGLRRVYYSAFSPIPRGDSRLPVQSPPLVREHRLYQADWLMRQYGFDVSELTSDGEPNLSLDIDPKLAWALRNVGRFPVDLNRGSREQLLRIPGIGKQNVLRILQVRRVRAIRLLDLPRLRISLDKVRPWVVTPDHRPREVGVRRDAVARAGSPEQLMLF
jgi:predicted DNA-binding helix-hairpin-helix protein